jgi:anthranilate synthase/aminodeoxychorismate synthase-like glutamine amidotransferase
MASKKKSNTIFMLDNYDSFTYNLVHYLEKLDAKVVVERNDQTSIAAIEKLEPSHIIISPGPCSPDQSGLTLDVINHFKQLKPILGVCLGHQAIAQVFGGKVIRAKQVVHGKTSKIYHHDQGVFTDLPQGFSATRYHSLVVEQESLPTDLEITAWTKSQTGKLDEIMGIKHKSLAIEGVQFHPESILSEYGLDILKSFFQKYI